MNKYKYPGFRIIDVNDKREKDFGGISFKKPEPDFIDCCLKNGCMALLCERCNNADLKLNKCKIRDLTRFKLENIINNEECIHYNKKVLI